MEKSIKAQAEGRNGKIDFNINIKDNIIEDISVTKSSETPAIFNQVFSKFRNKVLQAQSFNIDAISGASIMTKAMINAGNNALKAENISVKGKTSPEKSKKYNIKVDVAVIGSGMAGLMAASRALSMGKKVLILEKNGYLGGATILNGSNVVGTGSKIAKKLFGELARKDSSEQLIRDITRECRGTNDIRLSALLANNIGKAVDFIAQFANLTYQKAETQTIEHTIQRQIEMPSESSYELVTKVANAFLKKGGQIILDARVEKLNKDKNGKLSSLVANGRHQIIEVKFKSLVLAAGGWGARDYKAHKTNIPYYGPMTSTGDYFDFAKDMNLVTRNLDWYKVYPHGVEVEPGIAKLTTYSTKAATDSGAIFVNSEGKRIVNETAPYTHFRDAIARQKDQVAYIIMDRKMWNTFYILLLKYGFTKDEIQSFFDNKGLKNPIFVKGSLNEIAESAKIDEKELQKTINRYQREVNENKDVEFSKNSQFLYPFEGNVYYAVEQRLRFCTTLGGYETTQKMQLLDKNINPIDNFYAAGEIIGGANGHDSMPSMMNSWSYASGFVAGTEAADNSNF